MPRTYPRIGKALRLKRRKCEFCEHQGLWEVHVQTTWTRGDDEVFYLCHEHESLRAAANDLLLARAKARP